MSAGHVDYLSECAERIREELPPDLLPRREAAALLRHYAVLALTLGARVRARDVHDAWAAWMAGIDPSHPCLVPFEDLAPGVRARDAPFVDAIRRASSRLGRRART